MRLLFVVPEFDPNAGGGIATFYRHLVPAVARRGHQVTVCVANPFGSHSGPSDIPGVTLLSPDRTHFDSARQSLHTYAAIPELHGHLIAAWAAWETCDRGEGFDLVETTDWGMLFAPWLSTSARPPVVVQLHASNGQVTDHDPCEGTELYGMVSRLLETFLLPRADELQTYGKPNQADWRSLLDSPVEHLDPGWKMPDPDDDGTVPELAREPFGLVVGRVQTWKGVETLCKACRRLGETAPRILWVGRTVPSRGNRSMGDLLSAEYPDVWGKSVLPVGSLPREQTSRLQAAARFVIVPSEWDVFNLTAVEGMGAGRVVICSDGAGAADLIRDRENGFVFKAGDDQALATAIATVSRMDDSGLRQIGDAGRETVQVRLDPDSIADERLSRYEKIIANRRRPSPDHPWLGRLFVGAGDGADPLAMLERFSLRQVTGYTASRLFRRLKGGRGG